MLAAPSERLPTPWVGYLPDPTALLLLQEPTLPANDQAPKEP